MDRQRITAVERVRLDVFKKNLQKATQRDTQIEHQSVGFSFENKAQSQPARVVSPEITIICFLCSVSRWYKRIELGIHVNK